MTATTLSFRTTATQTSAIMPHIQPGRASQGLALAQNTLLPIAVPRIGGLSYGLHPSFGTVAGGLNPGLHELWAQQKMAVVSNVGTLVRPITRAQYQDGSVPKPRQLFSHTDQSNQQMNARADIVVLSGWGGRMCGQDDDPGESRPADTDGWLDQRNEAIHDRRNDTAVGDRTGTNTAQQHSVIDRL